MYNAFDTAATQRGLYFLNSIQCLLNEPTDHKAVEKSMEHFLHVIHQVSGMVFEAASKEISLSFNFPAFGTRFEADSMRETAGDTVGLNVGATDAMRPIVRELHGAQVLLCMLPCSHIAYFRQTEKKFCYLAAYKANVLTSFGDN
jgi:hypothetical protein